MNDCEDPPLIPELPPEISRGKLWVTLLIPPLVAGFGTPLFGVNNIVIATVTIVIFMIAFMGVVHVRYRGHSLTFLGFAYLIGQSMICLVVGWGACLIMSR